MAIPKRQNCCLTLLSWIPVVFIIGVFGWSYYAYVVQMCLYTIENIPKKVIYLVIYHLLVILFLWSYGRTIFTASVVPPRQFFVNEIESENISSVQTIDERRALLVRLARQSTLPLLTRHFDGSIRYCFACQCMKPDRSHHCSVCGKCVLRYDHHCPWTNSCISYGNYKYFVLFLGYAFLFCLFVASTSIEYFISFWKSLAVDQKDEISSIPSSGKFHLLFLFFLSIMFGISVASLFFYHLFLTSQNRTTIESYRSPIFATGPEKDGFHLGTKRNFQEIFGFNFFRSFLPIFTTLGDGIHYEMNERLKSEYEGQIRRSSSNIGVSSEQNSNLIRSSIHRSNDVLIPIENPSTNSNRNQFRSH